MKTVAFHTLGCKVNQYDTQAMLELFQQAGYEVVPFQGPSDVYVINTCTVTGTGDKKSMQLLHRIQREHPQSEVVFCGCLAQRLGEELLSEGIRLILGVQRRGEVVTLLEEAVRENKQICAVRSLDNGMNFEPLNVNDQAERTRATLKIQEGCNNHCTYCVIPSVRGPIRSRSLDDIANECQRLAKAGFTELVLTGIHLASYGKEWKNGVTLLDAIRVAQETPGIARIRLGSLEPNIATADFAAQLAAMDKVCPQFHLALQSGSRGVLARMARQYNPDQYLQGVENLRAAFPHAAFTTDVLTGFPGETEAEYEETREMIRTVGFAKIHVFPYSRRAGTKADAMPDQLSKALKEQRARELIALGNEVAQAYRESWLNKTAWVLVEERENDGWVGYTPEYLRIQLPDCPACHQGALLQVKLTALTEEGMTGELV